MRELEKILKIKITPSNKEIIESIKDNLEKGNMIAALELSKNRGNITQAEVDDALAMIKAFEFPVSVKELEPKDIVMVSKSDKKMDAGVIKFILLDDIGHAYIDKTVTDEEMINALKLLM